MVQNVREKYPTVRMRISKRQHCDGDDVRGRMVGILGQHKEKSHTTNSDPGKMNMDMNSGRMMVFETT